MPWRAPRQTSRPRTPAATCSSFANTGASKFEVSFDPQHGTIRLDTSKLTLDAKDGHLLMKLENDDPATLARHTGVVTDHLKRFAFREDLAVEWQARTAA